VLDALLEYQVLVVPDPPSGTSPPLPPYLLNRTTSDNVRIDAQFIKSNANPLPIPPGIPIRGHLMAPGGPATGATISLHSYLPPPRSDRPTCSSRPWARPTPMAPTASA
jgi:hypothetical protein